MADDTFPELGDIDGVTPARQARSKIAQERLLETAEAIFAARGWHGAHITEISTAAGYSIGTFYLRFRDKEAVFQALRHRFVGRGRANIDRFFALPRWADESPTMLVQTYIVATARIISKNAGFFRALYQRSLDGEAESDWVELRAATRKAGTRLAAYLRERAPRTDRPDLDELCVFCLSAVEGTIIHRLLNRAAVPVVDEAYFLRGLSQMATACLGLPPPPEPFPPARADR